MKITLLKGLGAASLLTLMSVPAMAHDELHSDSNSHWLDYKTDVSEAERELDSDLARAHDEGDRADAWSEYRRELADAQHDFEKEMIERGYTLAQLRGTVTVGGQD